MAKADPSLKILILEAGAHTLDKLAHIQPAEAIKRALTLNDAMKYYVANPSEHLGGRSAVVPCAECFGGGSSVNGIFSLCARSLNHLTCTLGCVYTRASASDYDDWEKKYGNSGWSCEDLLPLLKKACFRKESDSS